MQFINIATIASIVSASAAQEKDSTSGYKSGLRSNSAPADLSQAPPPIGCVPGLSVPVPGVKRNGDQCSLDCECFSAKCDFASYNPFDGRTCQETVAVGEPCNEDTDCLSNNCPGGFFGLNRVCALKENGEPCGWEGTLVLPPLDWGVELSALCESGRCEFASLVDPFGTCAAKLDDGEGCIRADDCVSGNCGGPIWWRTCRSSALSDKTNTLSLA